jgi:hypothetical protein
LRLRRRTCGGVLGVLTVGHSAYSQGVGCTHRSCSRESPVRPHAAETNKRVCDDSVNRQCADADGNGVGTVRCSVSRLNPWPPCHAVRGRALAGWIGKERTAGRGLRRQTTPSLPSAAVACAKQRCAHIHTCVHFCALPHLPRGPFRDAERLGAVQRAGAAERIPGDGRAPTRGVARPRAPLGQAVRALHVRRYHTLSTHSGHTAHHSARPCGPSHSQQCAAVAACCTETRPTALRSHVVGFHNGELRVPIGGTQSAHSGYSEYSQCTP